MIPEIGELRIKAERIGTVREVKQLLTDLENAYNSIYVFLLLGEELSQIKYHGRFFEYKMSLIQRAMREDYPYDLFVQELTEKIDLIVSPGERLTISKINFQSPGYWEFLGLWEPLLEISKFLKYLVKLWRDSKHATMFDDYKSYLQIMEMENEIIIQKIKILESLGYTKPKIRQFLKTMLDNPFQKLRIHFIEGIINGVED